MKKGLWVMVAVALQAVTPVSQAARASATFDVSFRVQESCAIRTVPAPDTAAGKAAPAQDAEVRCEYQTPYRLQAADAAPSSAPRRTERPRDTDAPAALTVWF